MASLTQPLDLRRFIRITPKSGFDCLPYLDFTLIVAFIFINVSSFVILPGVAVELPSGRSAASVAGEYTTVLTIDRNEAFFFEGNKIPASGLEEHLRTFVDEFRPGLRNPPHVTLLLKSDASVSASFLIELMELARSAGFSRVLLASESGSPDGTRPWESSTTEGP